MIPTSHSKQYSSTNSQQFPKQDQLSSEFSPVSAEVYHSPKYVAVTMSGRFYQRPFSRYVHNCIRHFKSQKLCFRCGHQFSRQHLARCPAAKAQCRSCSTRGHFSRCCFKKRAQKWTKQNQPRKHQGRSGNSRTAVGSPSLQHSSILTRKTTQTCQPLMTLEVNSVQTATHPARQQSTDLHKTASNPSSDASIQTDKEESKCCAECIEHKRVILNLYEKINKLTEDLKCTNPPPSSENSRNQVAWQRPAQSSWNPPSTPSTANNPTSMDILAAKMRVQARVQKLTNSSVLVDTSSATNKQGYNSMSLNDMHTEYVYKKKVDW